MSSSVNKVILLGNLGKDPEVRYLENGTPVARFSIATTESYIEKSSGEKREITDWHNIVAWRGLAKLTEGYLKKGFRVYVEGKLKTRSWQDETNQMKYTTEVVADDIVILTKTDGPSQTEYPKSIENNPPQNMDTNISAESDEEDNFPF